MMHKVPQFEPACQGEGRAERKKPDGGENLQRIIFDAKRLTRIKIGAS